MIKMLAFWTRRPEKYNVIYGIKPRDNKLKVVIYE